ncbi:MAG: DUF3267 domain-containing protein [Bacilli bacterium]|nr:DUF3267 domain-containing protein [Bacilli bacterium]
MSTTNKKVYVYKMNLIPANVLSIVILILAAALAFFLRVELWNNKMNYFIVFILIILYLMLHELLHGIGYFLGGTKRKYITYGIELEKGIFYAMAYSKLTKKNILISLQMPFMVIGVITYIIGVIFNIPLLVLLSVVNISGASMDLAMFIYFLRLPKDFTYSESGNPDEFVIISSEDLTKKKSIFTKIVEVKDYKEKDFEFKNLKKIKVTKASIIVLVLFLLLGLITTILKYV